MSLRWLTDLYYLVLPKPVFPTGKTLLALSSGPGDTEQVLSPGPRHFVYFTLTDCPLGLWEHQVKNFGLLSWEMSDHQKGDKPSQLKTPRLPTWTDSSHVREAIQQHVAADQLATGAGRSPTVITCLASPRRMRPRNWRAGESLCLGWGEGCAYMGAEDTRKISIPSSEFCSEPKTALILVLIIKN